MAAIGFAAPFAPIPGRPVAGTRAAVARALWHNRPHWRATMIMLGVFHKPWMVDPGTRRTVCTILQISKFRKASPLKRTPLPLSSAK